MNFGNRYYRCYDPPTKSLSLNAPRRRRIPRFHVRTLPNVASIPQDSVLCDGQNRYRTPYVCMVTPCFNTVTGRSKACADVVLYRSCCCCCYCCCVSVCECVSITVCLLGVSLRGVRVMSLRLCVLSFATRSLSWFYFLKGNQTDCLSEGCLFAYSIKAHRPNTSLARKPAWGTTV